MNVDLVADVVWVVIHIPVHVIVVGFGAGAIVVEDVIVWVGTTGAIVDVDGGIAIGIGGTASSITFTSTSVSSWVNIGTSNMGWVSWRTSSE